MNSRILSAFGFCAVLGLFALAASGCSNHGPVNLFSQELFGKYQGPPDLQVVSYGTSDNNGITVTASTQYSGCTNCFSYSPSEPPSSVTNDLSGYYCGVQVSINNVGASGTYGPVNVTITSSDPNMMIFENNPPNELNPLSGLNLVTAVSYNIGSGIELMPAAQSTTVLYEGYVYGNNSMYQQDQNWTFYFVYNESSHVGFNQLVPVTLAMEDAIGYRYSSVIYLNIVEN